MTILTLLWRFTIGGAWKYIAAGLSFAALYLKGRSDAKAKAEGKQAVEGLKAATKGRDVARKGRSEATDALRQGKTPEEIVRGNDDAWR